MKTLKKYTIEFFVIVLGVSVSFLAEQWRQEINDRSEAEEMVQEARKEARLLLSFEELSPGKSFPEIIKRAIDQKEIHPDTLLSILSFLETDLPLHKFIPSLFKSANSNALPPNQIHLLQSIVGNSERMILLGQSSRTIIRTQLYPLMDKHSLLNDYMAIKINRMVDSRKNGPSMMWEFSTLPSNHSGRYDQFMRDEEVLRLLRMINIHMIDESILVIEVKYLIEQFLGDQQKSISG